jgi:Outer membrane lipoprotein carrier protein LolA
VLLALLALAPFAHARDAVFERRATPQQLLQLAASATSALQSAQVVRGQFVQRRNIAELPRPLQSKGEFLFARGLGIEWRTTTPFASQLVITKKGLAQRDDSGASRTFDASKEPAVRIVAEIFFAVFALDLRALEKDFVTFGMPRGSGWVIGLEPKQAYMRGLFAQILIAGGKGIDTVTLIDPAGELTVITLANTRYESTPLAATERTRFAR